LARKPKEIWPKAEEVKSQSERFIEAARALECDESGEAFEIAFRKIVVSRDRSKHDADERPDTPE